jgi:hypothetical protein
LKPIGKSYPSVLGISSNVSIQDLVNLTNQRRQEAGLAPLALNDQLSNAAAAKASYMFEKNFWAHVAPDGTTPWYFIKNSGYEYLYAGENLARGYNSSGDVVNAWMASPTHRENMLSPNYKDIGFAVQTGSLTGSDTVLVVEEFGSKYVTEQNAKATNKSILAQANVSPTPITSPVPTFLTPQPTSTTQIAAAVNTPLFDTKSTKKNLSLMILAVFIVVLIADALIVERRKIERAFSHNLDHIIFLIVLILAAIIIGGGIIL